MNGSLDWSATASRKLACRTFMADMPRWFVAAKHLREAIGNATSIA
jgi:hypothetical protein